MLEDPQKYREIAEKTYKQGLWLVAGGGVITTAWMVGLTISGCQINIPKEITITPPPCQCPNTPPGTPPPTPTVVSWKGIQNGLNGNCVSCHNPSGQASFAPMTSYDQVKQLVIPGNGKDSKLCKRVQEGTMPPAPATISKKLIEDICAWIEQGAKEI